MINRSEVGATGPNRGLCLSFLQEGLQRGVTCSSSALQKDNLEACRGACLVNYCPTKQDGMACLGVKNLEGESFIASLCKVTLWASVYHLQLPKKLQDLWRRNKKKDQIVKNTKRVVKVKMESKSKIDKSILKRMIQMMILIILLCFGF